MYKISQIFKNHQNLKNLCVINFVLSYFVHNCQFLEMFCLEVDLVSVFTILCKLRTIVSANASYPSINACYTLLILANIRAYVCS